MRGLSQETGDQLIGRLLETNMFNLGLEKTSRELMADMDYDFDEIRAQEPDPGFPSNPVSSDRLPTQTPGGSWIR